MRKILPLGAAAFALVVGSVAAEAQTRAPPMGDDSSATMEHAAPHRGRMHRGAAPRGRTAQRDAQGTDIYTDTSAPPTSQYRGGVGSPYSTVPANLPNQPGRSEMGKRLPDPATSGTSAEDYLTAANRALQRGNSGAAQEALERAETRALTRTTDASMVNQPDNARMVQAISAARMALGRRDMNGARAAIQDAMGAR